MNISDQIRNTIAQSGKSANAIAREVGIPQPTITRFLNGAEMKSSNLDKLAAYFGLVLVPGKEAKPTKPAKKVRK